MRLIAPAVLFIPGMVLAGCASNDAPRKDAESATGDAHKVLPVGASAAFGVYAHCGFEFTQIDGSLWRTELRDDGQGNPPDGWPEVVEGTIERTAEDLAVFVSASPEIRAAFRPAPGATYICG